MDTTNHCPHCEALATEVASLRKAVAVKDERIAELEAEKVAEEEESLIYKEITEARAALSSPPSGMRVMSVEQLKEIEWADRHILNYCPVCCEDEAAGHRSDCWLSALIGGDDGT